MKTIKIFGVLIASAALTACGGGDGGDNAEPADAGSDATQAAAPAAEDTNMAEAPAPEPEPAAEEPAPEPAPEPEPAAEEPTMAGGGDDGAFMVAGLTGDPAAGRRIFARCQTCHVLAEGQNRVGPSLYGIFGREAGSVEGFRYSDANANSGITWTADVMFEYLENPRGYMPGTNMAFPGLRNPQDRADVIAYMKENGGEG